ncbi:cytochrome c550 [Sporosarcina sp. G11-34]|uniref:cytochrome c550 n=1 Tax=Sporosarcina sp. G11-34 TaxID=2849605 RepID=UPI0022A9698F|nr:cytochrome c [Sporosarcina sp. G11-34]MCZ2259346.1 cytochrome c [Sporosarcina sp. G11-34]
MSKNPVIPYILIFSLGLGLIFFMSLYGVDQKKEITGEGEGTEQVEADFDPEVAIGKCIGCHGGELEGGMGPALVGTAMSADDIVTVINEGKGSMPPAIIPAEHAEEMADYILSLK